MKKLYILALTVGFGSMALAQDIEIYLEGESVDVSGTVITLEGGESIHQDFDVKNVAGAEETLRVERVKISEIAGATDYLCWGADELSGTCYPSSTVAPYDPWITPDESIVANDGIAWLSIYYNANDNVGTSSYRYYIVDDADVRRDSIDVNYASTVGIEDLTISTSVYPNPANNVFNIAIDGNANNLNVIIYNVIGEAVLSQNLKAGVNTLSTENLVNGVYFYAIRRGNDVVETKKLVIRK